MTRPIQTFPDAASYATELLGAAAGRQLPPVPAAATGLLAALPGAGDRQGWPWTLETPPATAAMGWPKLTIVMPSYRQAAYLEAAIRSVLLQNYPRLEFIVLDGGSADDSPAIIERYRPWLSFARVARDRGQSHAINLGFSIASGDIVAWLNSDDLYLPGTLHRVAAAFRRGVEFVYGDALELDQESATLRYVPAQAVRPAYVRFPGLFFQPSAFWLRSVHQPLWEAQHCALDYELWIRLLRGRRVAYVPGPLSVARQHGEAKTYDPKMKQRWDEDAARNGAAHPELYRPTWRNRWLAVEYRLVQRMARGWRSRNLAEKLAAAQQACGWSYRPVGAGEDRS